MWNFYQEIIKIDPKKEEGNELDEAMGMKAFERFGQPLTAKQFRKVMTDTDIDGSKRISFAEILCKIMFCNWVEMVKAPQGDADDDTMINAVNAAMENSRALMQDAESKKAAAEQAEADASKAAADAAQAKEEALAGENDAKAKEAEAKAKQAEVEALLVEEEAMVAALRQTAANAAMAEVSGLIWCVQVFFPSTVCEGSLIVSIPIEWICFGLS